MGEAAHGKRMGDGSSHETWQACEDALSKLRPTLRLDGGDVRLLEVSNDGVVRVGLTGTCAGCPMSRMLLQIGIEASLRNVPQVTRVVTVDERVPVDR
jgi:Fe-S cluster biogenesis protein NfuA